MNEKAKTKKCLVLMSGGLDSLLAAKIMLEQGVHVEAVTFLIGFAKPDAAIRTAAQLDIKLRIVDVIKEFQEVVANPKHGYGANLNPCLDCKIFMVTKAYEWMQAYDFDFLVTGEVLGQRPMSQRRDTLPVIAEESGAGELLVRPLCAKLLSPTLPEREGWIERERLYGFSGRSRKPQLKLAKEFGIERFSSPAGGCLLTEERFCDRIRDLWQARGNRHYNEDDIELLKVGRHLRLNPEWKLIVGRNEGENYLLAEYRGQFTSLETISCPGPTALIVGDYDEEQLLLAARIVAGFSKGRDQHEVMVQIEEQSGDTHDMAVKPYATKLLKSEWYV